MTNKLDKIADPVNFYQKPIDVEHDNDLTIPEKIKLLKNWIDDINLRQIAENENMPATDEPHYHTAEVERLLNKYQTEYSAQQDNQD